jgi:hypothetical protein
MDQIKQAYEQNVAKLDQAFMAYDWRNRDAYAEYLAQTYRYICHSTKLLAYAADVAKGGELKECLKHHVAEETGHEHWVAGDLKRLGYNIKDFPENPQTKDLYDSIYQGIKQEGPAAIVGYALALEGMSARVCPKLAPELTKMYGAKCSTFIKNHAEIDPGHAAESFNILKYFSENEKSAILKYMEMSTKAYLRFLAEISTIKKNAA